MLTGRSVAPAGRALATNRPAATAALRPGGMRRKAARLRHKDVGTAPATPEESLRRAELRADGMLSKQLATGGGGGGSGPPSAEAASCGDGVYSRRAAGGGCRAG